MDKYWVSDARKYYIQQRMGFNIYRNFLIIMWVIIVFLLILDSIIDIDYLFKYTVNISEKIWLFDLHICMSFFIMVIIFFSKMMVTVLNFLNDKEFMLIAYNQHLWNIANQIDRLDISKNAKRKLFFEKTKRHPLMQLSHRQMYRFKKSQRNLIKLKHIYDFSNEELKLINHFLNKKYPDEESQRIQKQLSYLDL